MAWFGPRGVATMTYSLLVLASGIAVAEELFGVAALVVVCSILAHGLTDTPGSEWLARRSGYEADATEADATEAATSSGRE